MKTGLTYFFSMATAVLLIFASCKSKQNTLTVSNDNGLSNEQQVKFQSTFYNACKEKIKGNLDIAETLFNECLKIDQNSAPVQYEIANLFRFKGKYDDALKYAKMAASRDPKNVWFQLLYIDCLHNKRLYEEACTAYEKLIKMPNPKPEYYMVLADEYLFANKPEKAIKVYEDYEKTFGRDEEAAIRKVNIQRQLKKWDDAEVTLKNLIKDFPDEPRYYTYLAEIYQETGRPEKALDLYNESLKTDPNNPYIHLALADYYRMQKKDSLFIKEVKIAFNNEDLDVDSKVKIVLSYYDMTEAFPKYLPEAYDLLEIMKKVHPAEPKVWSIYGDFLFRDKKYAEAKSAFERVLDYDKSKFAIWSQLFVCEMSTNNYVAMEAHSLEAIELFPNQPNPYFFNGLANQQQKKYLVAIQSYIDGLEFVYDNAPLQMQFLINLGECYNSSKQFEKSDKAFEEALLIDPSDASVMNNYAYYLSLRKEKLERAAKLSLRAIELMPGSISYMDTYAWVCYQQGKYDEAKQWLDKAMDKGAFNRPAILEHYGDVLFKLNDKTKALQYWQKAKDAGGNSDLLNKKILEGKLYE